MRLIPRLLAFPLLIALVSCAFAQGTVVVPAGGNFQAALDAAQRGDTIVLTAGAYYPGYFILPAKLGTAIIKIQSSRLSELPSGRVGPEHAHLMPKLTAPGAGAGALQTAPGASYYALSGLEILPATPDAFIYDLVSLGEQGYTQKTLESVPHHISIDRSYIHAFPGQGLKRGIALNSAFTDITNSYISDFKAVGQEAQAIAGWNGPGPYRIENNYLEAAGINVLFGGSPPAIPGLIPSGIQLLSNHFFKPLSWRQGDPTYAGTPWMVKNLLELKSARDVTIDGNTLENNWAHSQSGWGIIFNTSTEDSGPQQSVEDVRFTRNRLLRSANGILLAGGNRLNVTSTEVRLKRITIADNVIDTGYWNGEGKPFYFNHGSEDLTLEHNTVTGRVAFLYLDAATLKHTRLRVLSNLSAHGFYGIFGEGGFIATAALNAHAVSWVFDKNALYGIPADVSPSQYPAFNYFPATLGDTRELLGSDGLLVGVRGTAPTPMPSPSPSPTPTPTPQPSPSPSPSPTPTPLPPTACTMTAPDSLTVQRNSSTVVNVELSGFNGSITVSVTGSSGQVAASPLSKTVTGTSAIVPFKITVKRQSRTLQIQSACGTRPLQVVVP